MSRVSLFVALALALAVGTPIAACSSFGGEGTRAGEDGGSCAAPLASDKANCGTCGHACASSEACVSGACVAACAGIIYVAPDGDDARSGCSPAEAKSTLGSAIALVKASKATQQEIHACAGRYRESRLTVDVPVAVRGGYACRTFQRTATFGYPTFDGTNETVVESADGAGEATLLVTGSAIDRSVTIDGLTIQGAPTGQTRSVAMLVTGASPTISDNRILGAKPATEGRALATEGLRITSAASPDILHNLVEGGAGLSDTTTGSIGILVEGAVPPIAGAVSPKPHIHANVIHGGSGTGKAAGSIGLSIAGDAPLTGASAIEANTIDGGSGTSTQPATVSASLVGVYLSSGAEIALVGNRISGGNGVCSQTSCSVYGVLSVVAAPRPHLEQNAIYAGDLTAGATTLGLNFYGVVLAAALDPVITNNMIHGGNKKRAQASSTFGVLLESAVSGALVAHNTIVLAPGGPSQLNAQNIQVFGLNASVDDNLLVGVGTGGGGAEGGVHVAPCGGGSLASFKHNAFVGIGRPLLVTKGTAGNCQTVGFESVVDAETAQNQLSSATASGNVQVATSCGAAAGGCVARPECGSPYPGCIPSVLASFDKETAGALDLDSGGWKLKENGVCAIANGGLALKAVTTDFFGAARRDPMPSLGAHESRNCL